MKKRKMEGQESRNSGVEKGCFEKRMIGMGEKCPLIFSITKPPAVNPWRFKGSLEESGYALLPDSCWVALRALGGGYVWGAAPSPAEGESPSDSHLRFAAV